MHRNDYKAVKTALNNATTFTRSMGKRAAVRGWVNKAAGSWRVPGEEKYLAISVTPVGAAALQGFEGYEMTENVKKLLEKKAFVWHPCMRRPKDTPARINLTKTDATLTTVDLFAGVGGFRMGCEAIGMQSIFAVESDRFARESYEMNFGTPPEGADVTQVDTEDIPEHTMLTGGFPCGPFSTAGRDKRLGLQDPRGLLYLQVCRVLHDKKPETFLLENVPGVKKESPVISAALRDCGYVVDHISVHCEAVLPQVRHRVFFRGIRSDLAADRPRETPVLPAFGMTLRDVIDTNISTDYLASIGALPENSHAVEMLNARRRPYLIPENTLRRMEDTSLAKVRCLERHADLEGKARTLMASYKSSPAAYSMMADGDRFFTERECARMQGFPDSVVLHEKRAYVQFGNAVPPPVVAVLASDLLQQVYGVEAKGVPEEDAAVLRGWSAAAKLSLQTVNDVEEFGRRVVTLPSKATLLIKELAEI